MSTTEQDNKINNFWHTLIIKYSLEIDPLQLINVLKPTEYVSEIKIQSRIFNKEIINSSKLPMDHTHITIYLVSNSNLKVSYHPDGSHGQFGHYEEVNNQCFHPIHKYLEQFSEMKIGRNFWHGISYGILPYEYQIGKVKFILRYTKKGESIRSKIHPEWNYDQIYYNLTTKCIEIPDNFIKQIRINNFYDLQQIVAELSNYDNLPIKIIYENSGEAKKSRLQF